MKIESKKPSKQRKALYNYKNHQRSKLLSTRVADFLRDEYGKDFEGSVLEITKDQRVKIKEAQFEKTDGTTYNPPIHISNLVITKFTKEKKMDPWRANMIERKTLYGFWEEELTGPKKEKEVEKEL